MRLFKGLIIVLAISVLFSNCKKDEYSTDSSHILEFSSDTVLFDTVFTSVGSTTLYLKVYNNNDKSVQISNIFLAGGDNSNFRLNIDGIENNSTQNISIAENDSMYIFVEVTVDPNDQNSPMIITDSIIFQTNGNIQDVDLVAWGQDAYFHSYNDTILFLSGSDTIFVPYHSVKDNPIWDSTKPHVIYGYVGVDPNVTFTIQAGTKIHFHYNSGLVVWPGGTLKVNGKAGEEVIFQSDRLESFYDEIPGQWDRIWLWAGSINNEINHAIIKNGIYGIQADTVGNSNPTLKISNTRIENMNVTGLYSIGATIEANNCVFANCGQHSAALTIGGKYDFTHCTFANYWAHSVRADQPLLLLNNYYEDVYGNFQVRGIEKANFTNCILYGSVPDEIGFDNFPDYGEFNFKFTNCLLKMDEPNTDTTDNTKFQSSIINQNPNFASTISPYNYQLDTLSPAKDRALINAAENYPLDILGNNRLEDGKPDIGAYERFE